MNESETLEERCGHAAKEFAQMLSVEPLADSEFAEIWRRFLAEYHLAEAAAEGLVTAEEAAALLQLLNVELYDANGLPLSHEPSGVTEEDVGRLKNQLAEACAPLKR